MHCKRDGSRPGALATRASVGAAEGGRIGHEWIAAAHFGIAASKLCTSEDVVCFCHVKPRAWRCGGDAATCGTARCLHSIQTGDQTWCPRRTDGASRSTTRSSSAADVRSSGSRSSETGGWSRKCCERTRKEARPLDAQGEWGPDDPTPGSHQGRRR